MGAGSLKQKGCTQKVCDFLGRISYPLYVVHLPIVFVQMSWAARHADAPVGTHIIVAIFTIIIAIATAYASLKLYDEPLRKYLAQKLK